MSSLIGTHRHLPQTGEYQEGWLQDMEGKTKPVHRAPGEDCLGWTHTTTTGCSGLTDRQPPCDATQALSLAARSLRAVWTGCSGHLACATPCLSTCRLTGIGQNGTVKGQCQRASTQVGGRGLHCLLAPAPPPPSYLPHVDAQVLLLIGAVADHQAQLVQVAGFIQLHLLPQGGVREAGKKAPETCEQGCRLQSSSVTQPPARRVSYQPRWHMCPVVSPTKNAQDTHKTHGIYTTQTCMAHRLTNTD